MAVHQPQPHYQQSQQRSNLYRSKLSSAIGRVPIRLGLSYVVDWIIIIGIAAVGAAFWQKTANRRPFSPFDPSISFPYVEHEKVSTTVLAIVSVIIPAVLTAIIALALTPGANGNVSWRGGPSIWRRKIWEWNAAWLGLGLALTVTLLFTMGLKDIMGKPRPDLLARCMLSSDDKLQTGIVGGGIAQGVLVSWTSCLQPDAEILADGFQSFPSGHSSFSWCGMFYLTLYLCSKFSIAIPYLLPNTNTPEHSNQDTANTRQRHIFSRRNEAAAPPAYLFVLVLVPLSVATYIASSRYSDFRHHGFDIIFGSLMGIFFAWISFRIYHLPIRQGSGYAWAPRSASRAWGIGVGKGGYVGPTTGGNDNDGYNKHQNHDRTGEMGMGMGMGIEEDVEMGNMRGANDAEGVSNGNVNGDTRERYTIPHPQTQTRSSAGPNLSAGGIPLSSSTTKEAGTGRET